MKKIISFMLVLVLMFSVMQLSWVQANAEENMVPIGGNDSMTVFAPEGLSPAVQAHILAYFLGDGAQQDEQTRNILCTLFGHKFETSTTITVTHNVYSTSPKCVRNTYSTQTCTRCGYVENTLVDSTRISTCHG